MVEAILVGRDLRAKVASSGVVKALPVRAAAKKSGAKEGRESAGPAWFNMVAGERTPEFETDLRLLSMRGALDPKHHYRKGERVGTHKFSQIGTVIEPAMSFYGDRLTRRQKAPTMLDTLMRDIDRQQYLKQKYEALQEAANARTSLAKKNSSMKKAAKAERKPSSKSAAAGKEKSRRHPLFSLQET